MKKYTPVIITAVSFALVVTGMIMGEHNSVFAKAVAICLSCIGIG